MKTKNKAETITKEKLNAITKEKLNTITKDDLIVNHIPLAKSIAERFGLPFIRDDLVSEGMLALVKCADKFDPERGVTFGQFARVGVKNAMIKYIKKSAKTAGVKSLDDKNENGIPYLSIVGKDGQADRASFRDLLQHYLHPVEEWVITQRYFEKESFDSIADGLGFKPQRVSLIHSNAIAKLKIALAAEDEPQGEAGRRDDINKDLLQVVRKMMWDEWGVEVYEL